MKKLILALALAVATTAYSGTALAAGWSSTLVTITQIEVSDIYGSGTNYYLTFNTAPMNTGCSAGSSGQWQLAVTGSNAADSNKNIMTQAVAAKLAGRSVKVYFSGCTGGAGYPMLTGLLVQ